MSPANLSAKKLTEWVSLLLHWPRYGFSTY